MDLDLNLNTLKESVDRIKPLSKNLQLNVYMDVEDTISQILIIYLYTFFLRNNTDKCIEEYLSHLRTLSEYMKREKFNYQNTITSEERRNSNNTEFKKFFREMKDTFINYAILSLYYKNNKFLKKKVGSYIIMNPQCKYLLDIIKSTDDINIENFNNLSFDKKIKLINIIDNIYEDNKTEYYLHPLLTDCIDTNPRTNILHSDNLNDDLPIFITGIKDIVNRDSNDDEETGEAEEGEEAGQEGGGGGTSRPQTITRGVSYENLRIEDNKRPDNLTPINVNRLVNIYSSNMQILDDYINFLFVFMEANRGVGYNIINDTERILQESIKLADDSAAAASKSSSAPAAFASKSSSAPAAFASKSSSAAPAAPSASKSFSAAAASRTPPLSRNPSVSSIATYQDIDDQNDDQARNIKKIKTQLQNKVKFCYITNVINEIEALIDQIIYQQENFNSKKNKILDDSIIKRAMSLIEQNISKLSNIDHKVTGTYAYQSSDKNYKQEMDKLKKIVEPLIQQFSEIIKKLPEFIKGNNLTRTEISESESHDPELIKLINELELSDFNDASKLLNFISKIAEKDFGSDILDERRVCGEIDNEQIDGAQCIDIIKKCLTGTNKNECFDEFKKLDLDKDINLKTMDYGLAVSLAKSLGFLDTTVDIALDNIRKKDKDIQISERLKILFEAIKAKINNIDGVSYTLKSKKVNKFEGIPVRDDGGQTENQTGGGNINNYNNFIMNLDALKKNLIMKGGSNNYIIIKKNLNYLNELLKANDKQIESSDLRKINLLIDKLENGEQKLKKINNVIEGLIIAINLRKVDFTNINQPIIYKMLEDLYDKSKDRQEKNLHKVGTLVSLFNGLLPVLGVKFGTP